MAMLDSVVWPCWVHTLDKEEICLIDLMSQLLLLRLVTMALIHCKCRIADVIVNNCITKLITIGA